MDNKRLGVILVVLGLFVGGIILNFMQDLGVQEKELGCYPNEKCEDVRSVLSISHIAIGGLAFIFALGFYLLVFHQGEEAILKRLEEEKNKKIMDEKFQILLKGLDNYERDALNVIKNENGITQNMLKLKLDWSKAKISQIINDLEKKGLIKRENNGKTFSIYFLENF